MKKILLSFVVMLMALGAVTAIPFNEEDENGKAKQEETQKAKAEEHEESIYHYDEEDLVDEYNHPDEESDYDVNR